MSRVQFALYFFLQKCRNCETTFRRTIHGLSMKFSRLCALWSEYIQLYLCYSIHVESCNHCTRNEFKKLKHVMSALIFNPLLSNTTSVSRWVEFDATSVLVSPRANFTGSQICIEINYGLDCMESSNQHPFYNVLFNRSNHNSLILCKGSR